jgi:hypothetical protein
MKLKKNLATLSAPPITLYVKGTSFLVRHTRGLEKNICVGFKN